MRPNCHLADLLSVLRVLQHVEKTHQSHVRKGDLQNVYQAFRTLVGYDFASASIRFSSPSIENTSKSSIFPKTIIHIHYPQLHLHVYHNRKRGTIFNNKAYN